jgi:hypothetical protein
MPSDNLAEWVRALAWSRSSQGQGLERHKCHVLLFVSFPRWGCPRATGNARRRARAHDRAAEGFALCLVSAAAVAVPSRDRLP